MTVTRSRPTFRLPRLPLEEQVVLLVGAWILAFVASTGVVWIADFRTDVTLSAWQFVGDIAKWYLAFISGWFAYTMVPLFVANGRTRVNAFKDWLVIGVFLVVIGAFLIDLGFVLERWIYRMAGWIPGLQDNHFFDSSSEVGRILVEFLASLAVWYAVGGMVGAMIYRSKDWGWLGFLPAVALLGIPSPFEGNSLGFMRVLNLFDAGPTTESMLIGVVLAMLVVLVALALTWWAMRELRVR